MTARSLAAAAALLALLAATAGRARAADELPRRTTGLVLTPTQLLVSVGLPDLFGPEDRERLKSGFVTRVLVEYAIPVWRRRGIVYGGDFFAAVGLLGMASDGDLSPPGGLTWSKVPVDLTGDLGLRLDTYVGIFTISIANALSRSSF